MFNNIYQHKTVFVTGHTGFKGSWFVTWLLDLGAKVVGYSLDPPSEPNHFSALSLDIESIEGDIRNQLKVHKSIKNCRPDIVFHFAAQPLVRKSYKDPHGTFETNLIGTLNVLEACRQSDSVQAVINVTSDKCYENMEWQWGYREVDRMGGRDPYSASKSCSELLTSCYQLSFFPVAEFLKSHQTLIASVRAGNIIGGGDWGEDRLIPDIVRAACEKKAIRIRNPKASRPWQHVLDPLAGYLMIGQRLLERQKEFSGPWNFGPCGTDKANVLSVVEEMKRIWPVFDFFVEPDQNDPHEAGFLMLDCSKANNLLNWRPLWNGLSIFTQTVRWYREYYDNDCVITNRQIAEYVKDAEDSKMAWIS